MPFMAITNINAIVAQAGLSRILHITPFIFHPHYIAGSNHLKVLHQKLAERTFNRGIQKKY